MASVKVSTYFEGNKTKTISRVYTSAVNSLSHSVKVTDLGGKDGYYITTITATDEAGNSSEQVIKTYVDTTAPTISGAKVENITAKGFDVSCNVSDKSGVSKVVFPTYPTKMVKVQRNTQAESFRAARLRLMFLLRTIQ